MKEDFLKGLKEIDNYTFTENGATALSSTGNKVLDAFGLLGGMMNSSEDNILNTWYRSFYENKVLSMKLLFYIRDIRGGQGMRRVFRVIARSMAFNHPEYITNNLDNFLFFGRGDDVLCLLNTPVEKEVIDWIANTLECDMINVDDKGVYPSLLAKWLPSENASSAETKKLANKLITELKVTPRQYRKMLSKLRSKIGIVESLMSQNKWEEIEFDKLPAKAAMIYSDAFVKHVQDNYIEYLKKLASGDAKVNSASLFPVNIIHEVINKNKSSMKDKVLLEAMWNALPNYFGDKEETGICVVDTSGSMYGTPIEVAISLGMYCADKCKGPFKNNFITFSSRPKLQEIVGSDIFEKVRSMEYADWGNNTDLEKVFDLILITATKNNLKQEDLPSKLYIISDMQFDEARGDRRSYYGYRDEETPATFMQEMKAKFAEKGYTMPAIVYWNVRTSECGMFQETFEGENCCMVSGYSASLFKSVIEGTEIETEEVVNEDGEVVKVEKQRIDPIHVMETTLSNERYNRVFTGI